MIRFAALAYLRIFNFDKITNMRIIANMRAWAYASKWADFAIIFDNSIFNNTIGF